MPRRFKKIKPLIYVFCEGESEQAYTDFLKLWNLLIQKETGSQPSK